VTSSTSAEFRDTNILAYAYDDKQPAKHEIARQLVDRLGDTRVGVASIQVLRELFITLTRKLRPGLSHDQARLVVSDVARNWRILQPGVSDVLDAIDNAARWRLSFWDAMLLTAANRLGASVLWSEDLNDRQSCGLVTVRNPFAR